MQIYSDKLFKNHIDTIEIFEPQNLKSGFEKLEALRKQGFHLLGYLRYDLSKSSDKPLMYFEAFQDVEKYISKSPVRQIGIIAKPKITKDEYFKSVEYIKKQI